MVRGDYATNDCILLMIVLDLTVNLRPPESVWDSLRIQRHHSILVPSAMTRTYNCVKGGVSVAAYVRNGRTELRYTPREGLQCV